MDLSGLFAEKPIRCAFCGSTERNKFNSGMACWDDPNSACSRAGGLMKQRYGDDIEQRIAKVYEEACARAFRECSSVGVATHVERRDNQHWCVYCGGSLVGPYACEHAPKLEPK
jgi:hypothetical protein